MTILKQEEAGVVDIKGKPTEWQWLRFADSKVYNHSLIIFHTRMAAIEEKKKQALLRIWRNWNPCGLLVKI